MGVPRGEHRQPVLGRRRAARRRDVEPAMGPVGRRVAPGDELDAGPGLGECDRGGHAGEARADDHRRQPTASSTSASASASASRAAASDRIPSTPS